MKRFMLCLIAAALSLCPGVARAQDAAALDAAFNALKTYTFSESREALSAIDDAVDASYGDPAARAQLEKRLAAAILAKCTDDAARFICRELGIIGGEQCVPALTSLLNHETLAGAAVDALERNPSAAAGQALRDALGSASTRTRIGAINALANRRDTEAVNALEGLAADPEIGSAALRALALIGGGHAANVIQRAVQDGPAHLRDAAVDASLLMADGLLKAGDTAGAAAIYQAFLAPAQSGHVRAAALRGMVACEPAKALDQLLGVFESGDPVLERAAAGLLRSLPDDADLSTFAQKLPGLDAAGQLLLLPALSEQEVPIAAEVFVRLLSGDESVMFAALSAVPACGDSACVPLLVQAAATAKGETKRAVRECLSRMPGAEVNAALVAAAKAQDMEQAAEAVRSLGERGAGEAKADLMQLARTTPEPVCSEAWRALRTTAGAEDVPALVAMLTALTEGDARASAERTVAGAAARIAAVDDRADAAIIALAATPGEDSRASLLRVLGQIATPEALDALRTALDKESDALRAVVVEALAAWPDSMPADDLLKIASAPKNDVERAKAFEGCVRLMRASKDKPDDVRAQAFQTIAALARDDAEKKLILAALGELPTAVSFEVIDAYAQEPALAAEATLAAFNVAKAIWGAYPQLVTPRLAAFADSQDEELRKQANGILRLMKRCDDYITAWLVSGPHATPGKSAQMIFDETVPPAANDASWRIMPMGLSPDAFVADLGRAFGGSECVAFLSTCVNAPAASAAVLELGSNDGVKVWLNGELVHGQNVGRALTPGEDKVPVELKAGWNTLTVAVFQMGGDWGACARLRNSDGTPVTGLKAAVTPE